MFAIINGDIEWLTAAIKLTQIGHLCTDCDENFSDCPCEYCPNCEFDECVCGFGFDKQYRYSRASGEQLDQVREAAWKFAKQIYSPEQLIYFRNYVLKFVKSIAPRNSMLVAYIMSK